MTSSIKNYLLGLCIALCGFTSVSYAQDGATMIPGDAAMVFDFNLKKVTGKINYKMVEDMFWVGRLDYELEREFRYRESGEYETVANFYKNPTAAGIDTTGHMYWFMKLSRRSETIGFIIPISNRSKFQTAFNALVKKSAAREIKTHGNVKYYSSGRRIFLYTEKNFMYLELPYSEYEPYFTYEPYSDYPAMNDSTSTSVSDEERETRYEQFIKSKIDLYVNMPTSQSMAGNADFKSFKARDCDAGFWANFDFLSSEEFVREMPSYATIVSTATKGTYFHYYGFLNKGEIAIEFESLLNKEMSTRASKMYTNTFNPALLNYFKKDSIVAFGSTNVNLKEGYNYFEAGGQHTPFDIFLSEVLKTMFRKEINNDPEMMALRAKMDSLREIAYGYSYNNYYNYDDYGYGEGSYDYVTVDTVAAAPYEYAADTAYAVYYDDEESDEGNGKGKNKKAKKDKVKKEKKKKNKKGDPDGMEYDEYGDYGDYDYSDYSYDYDSDYEESYDEAARDSARELLWTLYEVEDSLESVIGKRYLEEAGITEDDIWHFFRGDMAAAITRLYLQEIEYLSYEYDEEMNFVEVTKSKKSTAVEYVVTATVDRKEKLMKFLDLMEMKGLLLKDGNMYRFVYSPDKLNHYVYIRDNVFFITNRHHLAVVQPQGYGTASLSSDANYIKNVSANMFYANTDITKVTNFFAAQIDRKEEREMVKAIGKYLSNASLTSSYSGSKITARMRVGMKNTSNNAILEIFKMIETLYLIEEVY